MSVVVFFLRSPNSVMVVCECCASALFVLRAAAMNSFSSALLFCGLRLVSFGLLCGRLVLFALCLLLFLFSLLFVCSLRFGDFIYCSFCSARCGFISFLIALLLCGLRLILSTLALFAFCFYFRCCLLIVCASGSALRRFSFVVIFCSVRYSFLFRFCLHFCFVVCAPALLISRNGRTGAR